MPSSAEDSAKDLTGLASGDRVQSRLVTGGWGSREIAVGQARFKYFVGFECLDRIAWSIGQHEPDQLIVVTDDTVRSLYGDAFFAELGRYAPLVVISSPAGESMKSMALLDKRLEEAIDAGASKGSTVVTFGGGVPGNFGGLLAALLFRGIRLIHVPTTTVAAMDSTISIKQAVNSSHGKNHIGVFHAPTAIYADLNMFATLPERELFSGLCEAAKNCLAIRPSSIPRLESVARSQRLADPDTLHWLLDESVAAKSAVTANDTKERREGLILEYGHTVGHAVELCDSEQRGSDAISHGAAIAFGMTVAARVSLEMGGLDEEAVTVHRQLAASLGAPLRIPTGVSPADLIEIMRNDNKRGYLRLPADEAAFVLLKRLGEPMGEPGRPLVPVSLGLVEDVLAEVAADRPARITEAAAT